MGGRVVRFICSEQELLTIPNHLVMFLFFHMRSVCKVFVHCCLLILVVVLHNYMFNRFMFVYPSCVFILFSGKVYA